MTIDVSNGPRKDETFNLYSEIRKYKEVTMAKYLPLFDTSGAATGNDVLGLMSQTVRFDKAATSVVSTQTSAELEANWLLATGKAAPGLFAEIQELNVLVEALKAIIKNNASLILGDFDENEAWKYNALTSGQRAGVKAVMDPVASFIVTVAP